MKRSGDRRRCHRQNVDIHTEPFQTLLMLHPEPLLLIDYQQTKVLKTDITA